MSLARSYAQALYDYAKESGANAESLFLVQRSLEAFSSVVDQNPELNEMLVGPSTSQKEKVGVVDVLAEKLGTIEPAKRLLVLMARKERLRWLPEVAQAYAQVRLAHEGVVVGEVVSAEALGAQDVEQIENAFRKKLGRKVSLGNSVDPELLAGLKVTVGGVTYDGTLRAQLERLKEKLMEGGSALSG